MTMNNSNPLSHLPSLIPFAVLVSLVALSGIMFEPGDWYSRLNKPAWTPPALAFPVAWTILYGLIAIAGWLAWLAGPVGRGPVFCVYALQLLLNAAWSWLFFGLQQPLYGLVAATLLLIVIGVNLLLFWYRRSLAGLLLIPYFLWVGFAVGLNGAIVWLN